MKANHSNRSVTPRPWLALAIAFTSAGVAGAQQTHPDSARPMSWPGTYVHALRSEVNGREYRIAVVLPQGYTLPANAAKRYPVLYLLDGGIALPVAQTWYKVQARMSDSLILVGLWPQDGMRRIDHTLPPWEHSGEDVLRMSRAGTCCGAALFVRVLREEIIPLIDRRYRATGDRGIYGHSSGGLFANYVLFEAPDLFARYAITSPSLGLDNSPLFTREAEFARTHTVLQKQVFFAVGSEECPNMCFWTQRMASTLRARNYVGLSVTSVILQGADHTSMAAYGPALEALYLPKQVSEPPDRPDVADSVRRITQEFVRAFAELNVDGIHGLLAGDSAFQGIVTDTIVRGRESYRALLQQRFAPIRSLDMRVKSIQVGTLGDPRRAIATASYTTHTHLRSGQSTWNDGELTFEFEKRSEGWRIIYVLDLGRPTTN